MLAAAITLNGCKETTSQPATNGASESNNAQTPSQAPPKADTPAPDQNQTTTQSPTDADAAQLHVVAPAEKNKEFATAKEFNYLVFAIGSEGAGTLYDSVNSLPTVFFIDTEGKIKLVTSGLMPLDNFKAVLEAQWPEGSI